jgi:hypothetical protein
MSRTIFAAVALLSLLPIAGSQAIADDSKVHSPLFCRYNGGAPALVNDHGGLYNPSRTLTATVMCPIVRDRTDEPPVSISVSFSNRSTLVIGDGKFTCRIILTNKIGTSGAIGSPVTRGETGSPGSTMTLPIPTATAEDASYLVKCKIPRRGVGDPVSTLGSIKVVEASPTD